MAHRIRPRANDEKCGYFSRKRERYGISLSPSLLPSLSPLSHVVLSFLFRCTGKLAKWRASEADEHNVAPVGAVFPLLLFSALGVVGHRQTCTLSNKRALRMNEQTYETQQGIITTTPTWSTAKNADTFHHVDDFAEHVSMKLIVEICSYVATRTAALSRIKKT